MLALVTAGDCLLALVTAGDCLLALVTAGDCSILRQHDGFGLHAAFVTNIGE
jgi:hypothetical protein